MNRTQHNGLPLIPGHPVTLTGVSDGDSLRISWTPPGIIPDRVRLIGIDAPEHGEGWYRESKRHLHNLLAGGEIRLTWECASMPQRGRFGRLLAHVWTGSLYINAAMVHAGLARPWAKYGLGAYADQLLTADRAAAAAGPGIHGDPSHRLHSI